MSQKTVNRKKQQLIAANNIDSKKKLLQQSSWGILMIAICLLIALGPDTVESTPACYLVGGIVLAAITLRLMIFLPERCKDKTLRRKVG